jgi:hypothetical protein
MKELKTTHGETMIVDDEDYEKAKQYRWAVCVSKKTRTIKTRIKGEDGISYKVTYKNLILGLDGKLNLMKNKNPLDLRKENIIVFDSRSDYAKAVFKLYPIESFERSKAVQCKKKRKTEKTELLGVNYIAHCKLNPWNAKITFNGKLYDLGYYTREEYAAMAYDLKAWDLYGDVATRNYPLLTKKELIEKLSKIKEQYSIDIFDHYSRKHQGRLRNVPKTSQYVGVCFNKKNQKWRAGITCELKHYFLGYFFCEEDAARAYDQKAIELYGENIRLNFPLESRPNIKELKTINNETFIIDAEDYEKAKQYRWRLQFNKEKIQVVTAPTKKDNYAKTSYKTLVLGLESKKTLFKNDNPLDLRKENLLIFDTQSEFITYIHRNSDLTRSFESKYMGSKSIQGKTRKTSKKYNYIGIRYKSGSKYPWSSTIAFNNNRYYLGSFTTEKQAAIAYDIKAIEIYGDDADRNFPNMNRKKLMKKLSQLKEKETVEYKSRLSRCNQRKVLTIPKTSQYRGVSLRKGCKKWHASISYQNKDISIGSYYNEEDAAKAYDLKALELHGPDAFRNFPDLTLEELSKYKEKDLTDYETISRSHQGKKIGVSKSSQYIGVHLNKENKWSANIMKRPTRYQLGSYAKEEYAAMVYDLKALELYGDTATRNLPLLTKEELIEKVSQIKKQASIDTFELLSKKHQGKLRKGSKSSQYVGVNFHKRHQKWCANICYDKKLRYLGSFSSEEDAARAYDKKALELFGENANLNFPNQ